MNHKVIIASISFLIIAIVIGGVLYLQWPKEPEELQRFSYEATSTTTGSLLDSTPKPVLGPPAAEAAPSITWTPNSITRSILAGQSVQVPVSFISSENLSNVVVRVVPELQPYVKTTPTSFANLVKGQTVNLGLTISALSNSLPQTILAFPIRDYSEHSWTFPANAS